MHHKEPWTCVLTSIYLTSQFYLISSIFSHSIPWSLLCFLLGPISSHFLMVTTHEYVHNLVFSTNFQNHLGGIISTLSSGIPFYATYKANHLYFHLNPKEMESSVFDIIGKGLVKTNWNDPFNMFNILLVIMIDYWVLTRYGLINLCFMIFCSWFGNSLWHPISLWNVYRGLHFNKSSFYGKYTNIYLLNIGYYQEHHEHPNIPWSGLPILSRPKSQDWDEWRLFQKYYSVIYNGLWQTIITNKSVQSPRLQATINHIQIALNKIRKQN